MRWNHIDTELLLGQDAHMLISLPIMRIERRHLIKDLAKVVLDFLWYRNSLLKEINIRHLSVNGPVLNGLSSRVSLLQVGNDDLMDLESQFFFDHLAHRCGYLFCECLIDLLFVIVDSDVWRFQVLDVDQHIKGVAECHGKEVQLIQSLLIL